MEQTLRRATSHTPREKARKPLRTKRINKYLYLRKAVCCVASRSAILHRTSVLPTATSTRRRPATAATGFARRGLYRLAALLPYHLPRRGRKMKDDAV